MVNQVHPITDPRAPLLDAFITRLNATGVTYAVMNNYEDLPYVIPSDIDMTVPPAFFAKLDSFILDFAKATDAVLVQKLWHGNQKCAFILGRSDIGFLQLDFFVAFSTKSAPALLTHAELVADAREFGPYHIPKPEVELLFTVLRRLFKDDWSPRHCARIATLDAQITQQDWLPASFEWLEDTIAGAVNGDVGAVTERRAADWGRLRQTARRRIGPMGFVRNAYHQTRRILHRLRDETGIVVVTNEHQVAFDTATQARLAGLFHRHVQVTENSLRMQTTLTRLTMPFKIALLKRRKGLVLIAVTAGEKHANRLQTLLAGAGQVDLHYAMPPHDTAALTADIIAAQSRKTHRAILRGGTQTSQK